MTERRRLTRSAALASSGVALTLLGLKAWAALATGSVAMLGSLADTALDLLASLLTLFAVGLAHQPADPEHRFGHGKAEAVAALMQVMLIVASAAGIIWRAIGQLGAGAKPDAPEAGIAVSLIAIALTLALTAWQKRVVARTGSVAITTDRLHYQSDLILNSAVIAAFALDNYLGVTGADPVFGIGLGLWIGWNALNAARHALDLLMDREWPEDRRAELVALARSVPGVEGVHDLRTRSSGVTDFIQFHIWLPPAMTVDAAHHIVNAVEDKLHSAYPGSEVFIHIDPAGEYDARSQTAAGLPV